MAENQMKVAVGACTQFERRPWARTHQTAIVASVISLTDLGS